MMNTSRNKTKAEMAEEIAMLQKRVKKLEKTESKPRQTEIKLGNNGNNLGLLNSIIEETTDVIFVKDLKGRHLLVNSACAQVIGKSVKQIIGKNNEQLFPPEVARHLTEIDKQIIASGKPQTLEEVVLPAGSDSARTYLTNKAPLRDDNDNITGLIGVARDITERKQASRMLATQSEVLRMIALGVGLTEILARLCLLIEQQSAGALCSILLFDEAGGKLHSGAAPSLPQKYARALDGLMVGEGQGSCGTAVTRGKQVIVYDIAKDPLWAGFRKLALKHGIRSCWSTPFSSKEKVLGTFAISHKVPCRPTLSQQQLIQNATHLAGIATERKQAEEALRESEERYRSIVKQASDGFVLYDLDTKHVLDTNQAYEQMLGYTAEEMRRLTLYDIVAHDRQSIKSFVKRIREEKQVWIGERKHRCKDGSLLDVEVSSSLIVCSGKEVLTTVVRDISERRRAEEALKESDEKFRFLAENMADFVWTVDLDFRSTYASPSIKKVLGFTPEERKRHAPEEMLTPESLQRLTMKMQEELRRDKEQDVDPERYVTIEAEYYHAEGHTVWLENCVKALRDKSGAIIGLYGSARDITERKHAERALRKSEENNRLLVENSPHCIHQIDLQGRLISVNPAGVTMAGVSNELDIIGMRYLDTVADVDRNRIEQFLDAALKGEASEFEFRSSTEHIFASSFIPIFDDNGDVIRLMGISQDITERKQTEEALRESEAKYRQLVDHLPLGIYQSTKAGEFITANPAMVEMLGYESAEELLKTNIVKDLYFTPEERDKVLRTYQQDRAAIVTYRLKKNDGTELWVEDQGMQAFDYSHGDDFYQGVLLDITERKQAEKSKKDSDKRSRAWLENSPVCTKIVDPNFNLQFMSASGIRNLKIDDITEYYGKPYPFHFYPDSFKIPMTKNLKQVKKTGKITTQEASVVDIDGNELWYHSTLIPVNDDKGQLDYIMVVSLETTERKRAEEELRESERKSRAMIEAIPDMVF
ncbi:MAG: PAS domain S-box protein, partial [Caldithrix sp.]